MSIEASRQKHPSVDLAFDLTGRDAATGGAVLAGAIAFRLFLWTLPATLVIVGVLGFAEDTAGPDAGKLGLGSAATQSVAQAAAQAHRARWTLVALGTVFLLSTSRTLGATLRTATALTWGHVPRKGGYVRTAAVTAGIMTGLLTVFAFTSWLRHDAPGIGLTVLVVIVFFWTAAWWGVLAMLPHPELPWWGLLPGATLIGIGTELMHLVTVLYLSPKITSASALYGSLGTAATLLLGAYLLARLFVAGSALNATVHARAFGGSHAATSLTERTGPVS